ncbi:hypothetical protein GCM10028822_27780 [Hymenobacter terrigena]
MRVFFVVFLLTVAGPAAAQHLLSGYVVMVGGDSLRGALHVSGSPLEQQRLIRFVPLSGSVRLSLGPAQARAYGYVQGTDTVRYVSFSLPTGVAGTRELFLKQLEAGPVQLYERYETTTGRGTASLRREWLLRPARQQLVNTYWWNFAKEAPAFFRACPGLAIDLQAGRYHPSDLRRIVRIYNQCGVATP